MKNITAGTRTFLPGRRLSQGAVTLWGQGFCPGTEKNT
jgi:hypothetical protein